MLKKKKVLCIGAGFGGIAASLRLRAKGYEVNIIDRLPQLGGRAQVFEKEGFLFDGGPTVLTAPILFEELFQLFNKSMKDYVEILPLDLWYRYQFEDGKFLDYGSDLASLLKQIEKFNPDDVAGYNKLLKFSEKIFNVGFQKLSDQPFSSFAPLMKALPAMIRLKSYKSVYSLVSSFIEDDYLRKAFTISPLLVGGNPFTTTSIYALIHFLERKWGVHFPKGGTKNLVNALKKLMEEEGIKISLNTSVKEILVENGKAVGVLTDRDEKMDADIIVVNGDPAYIYKNLLPRFKRKKWTDEKIDRLSYSMGLFVLYFGTHKQYPEIPHHTILFGKTYKELLTEIFESKNLTDDLSVYLHRPSASDPSFAPQGKDTFYALAPVPHLQASIDWQKEGPKFQAKMINFLERRGLKDLRNNLAVSFFRSPQDFRNDYFSEWGAGFSIAPLFKQSAYFRFHNKSEEVESLYFVGAGTHPGAGMPGVLCSAKVLEKISIERGGL